jgi:hypothetical protein
LSNASSTAGQNEAKKKWTICPLKLLIDSIQIFKKEKATSYPHGFGVCM